MNEPLRDSAGFKDVQYAFAAHIRNPAQNAAPDGIEDRRLKIYRELFYNNVAGFIQGNFPVFFSLCSEEYWHRLIRGFFINYRCQTPYFLEIGEEFINYYQNTRLPEADDLPFAAELLHYEWVELALEAAEIELDTESYDQDGDLLSEHPMQSPLAWSLSYQYPVHCIKDDFIPEQPSEHPIYLLAYRNEAFEVKFMEINAVTARLLYLLQQHPESSGRHLLTMIAEELGYTDAEAVIAGGLQTMTELRDCGVLLGTVK